MTDHSLLTELATGRWHKWGWRRGVILRLGLIHHIPHHIFLSFVWDDILETGSLHLFIHYALTLFNYSFHSFKRWRCRYVHKHFVWHRSHGGLICFNSHSAVNDWTNPDYVLRSIKSTDTSDSRNTIISSASSSAKKGPWGKKTNSIVWHFSSHQYNLVPAVSTDKSIRAPSGNPRDYLSWAP